jgi:NAD(P)-dependent dehydrogenase (short-subunit alcohol dehydrogenase family)
MKNIVVVGASRGIGLEFARQLSGQGDRVFALCRRATPELKELPVTIIENCDVNNFGSLREAASQIPTPVNWFIHVAGVLHKDSLDSVQLEIVEEQLKTNALAPLKSVLAFKDKLQKGSKVALLTSRMGSLADNTSGGYYGYRMSKAALNAMGVSLAIDLKPKDITVLLLHPGFVRTDMTSHQGHIDPDESVRGLVKIINEKGIQDTGTFWHTDGTSLPW